MIGSAARRMTTIAGLPSAIPVAEDSYWTSVGGHWHLGALGGPVTQVVQRHALDL
jgi:hypothetical protein